MWKLRVGLMCVVNSPISNSSFFDFGGFLFSFLRVQIAIVAISIAIRDTISAVDERVMLIIILMSTSTILMGT